jgi:hypothetical protein
MHVTSAIGARDASLSAMAGDPFCALANFE